MATEAKTEGFTPGPWEIRFQFNVFSGNRLVANAGGYSNNWDSRGVERENVANAHLIAAAPDLYAALRDAEWVQTYGESTSIVVERCPWCGLSKKSGHAKNCDLSAALRKAGGVA